MLEKSLKIIGSIANPTILLDANIESSMPMHRAYANKSVKYSNLDK